jgi:Rab3 GTPase-activating protein catalytic subunit
MTADSFEEQKELFARMGSSAEATRLRAEIQGASLLSDMQAFKAANPACILEDFVRSLLCSASVHTASEPMNYPNNDKPVLLLFLCCMILYDNRWHSPKDWRPYTMDDAALHGDDGHHIDESLQWRGLLSKRMRSSVNFWHTLWTSAEAIPAAKQKPLFDHQVCYPFYSFTPHIYHHYTNCIVTYVYMLHVLCLV